MNYDLQLKLRELIELCAQDKDNCSPIVYEALSLAKSANDEVLLAGTIVDTAVYLENETLESAYLLGLQISEPAYRALALFSLVSLSRRLGKDQRNMVLKEALKTTLTIENVNSRISSTATLLNLLQIYLPKGEDYTFALENFEEFLKTLEDSVSRVDGLAILSSHFEYERNKNILQEALNIAQQIEDPVAKTKAMDILTPYLE
ncbi:MAG: hypothetical protein ABI947_27810 [Chloroflexota bacterium]